MNRIQMFSKPDQVYRKGDMSNIYNLHFKYKQNEHDVKSQSDAILL